MKKHTLLFLALGTLFILSCSNDAENDYNNRSLSFQQVKAQIEVNGTTEGLDELLADLWLNDASGNSAKGGTDCATINYTEKNISVAYNKCTINGHILNGSLILTGDNINIGDETGTFVIRFNAFSFNGYFLEGTKSFTFDHSEKNKPVFTIITDISIKNPKGETLVHSGTKTLTYSFGPYLDGPNNEIGYACVGEWDIVHNGVTYGFKIEKPLTGVLDCAYITAGVVALNVGEYTASLDFGQGVCDQVGTVTYPDGKSEEINW